MSGSSLSLLLLFVVVLFVLVPRGCDCQYFTGAQVSSVGFGGNASLGETMEPTCLTDYAGVWTRSSNVTMWAISGGTDYETDVTNVVYSSNAFATAVNTIPTYTLANAILRRRRAGGAIELVNGYFPAGSIMMWGGNTDEDSGDAALYVTSDNFATISRPRVTTPAPSPCPVDSCSTFVTYARFAFAQLPYTNTLIQAGGDPNGLSGSSDVWVSTNQGFYWSYYLGPFPAFISGSMVALFDGSAVPGSGSSALYSTAVLVVPGSPASTVWSSNSSGATWTQVATAPWAINAEVGYRKAMAMTVDASNNIYITGGNTATGEVWSSSTKGASWFLVPLTGSSYVASYASCLGVRYANGPSAPPTLVLYSGQIFTSLSVASTPYAVPVPSLYAVSFQLTTTTVATGTTGPVAVYPGVSQPMLYFRAQYSQSPFYQFNKGTAYTVCFTGNLTLTPHLLFGECGASNPCQLAFNAVGTRVFSNQTLVATSNIVGLFEYSNYYVDSPFNYIFPLSVSKVDEEGLLLYFDRNLQYENYIASDYTRLTQVDDTQMSIYDLYNALDTGIPTYNTPSNFSFLVSPTPLPTCSMALTTPPVYIISTAPLPKLFSTIDCVQQVGSVFAGNNGAQCPLSTVNTGINVVATGVTSPYQVNIVGPAGTFACSSPTLNTTNSTQPQQIACYPSADPEVGSTGLQWIGVQIRTLAGFSNTFPALLFGAQNSPPWPPAIYSITGSACVAASQLQLQQYGYQAIVCPGSTSTILTLNGEWFNTNTSVYVGGYRCGSQQLVSSNVITCTVPAAVAANTSAGYAQQELVTANNTLGQSTIAYTALLVGAATPVQSAYVCLLIYGLPGNVDYPWSTATSVQITYNPTPVTTAYGTGVSVLTALGTRTYTNRFGVTSSTRVVLPAPGAQPTSNLLYLNSQVPVDPSGLTFGLTSSIQLPGHGPNSLFTSLTIYNATGGVLAEGASQRVDGLGQAFLSNIPGFTNITIGASNINTLAVNYGACTAALTFTNGLRAPTQPSVSNGATRIFYTYTISDGLTYQVQGNLTITTLSAFASVADALGNPYQTVTNVTGTRHYTYFPTSQTIVSTVSGLSVQGTSNVDQRFYPYSLLASAPGVYTINSAPFLDSNGIGFNLNPVVPVNGMAPGSGTQYNSTFIYFYSTLPTVVLVDGYYVNPPLASLQQQSYFF